MPTNTTTSPSTTTITTTPTPTTKKDENECDEDDLACNPVYLLLGVIVLVLVLYFILMMTRIFLCFVYRRRQQNNAQVERTNREIEEIGHPFSYLAERGFDNSAFIDPPPTYEQLFKPDEPPPVYETPNVQRRALPTQSEHFPRQPSSSGITSAPVTYSQASVIPRSTSRSSLPTGAFGTSVPPVTAIVINESYRSRNNTMADSPDNSLSRPVLLEPNREEMDHQPEAESPTRENLI